MQGDSNDIPFNQYSIDWFADFDAVEAYQKFPDFIANLIDWALWMWNVYVVLSLFISAILFFGLIYAFMRHKQFSDAEDEFIKQAEQDYAKLHEGEKYPSKVRNITERLNVDDPNSWKLAIIEADTLLYETLEARGYKGLTVGEKLKDIPRNAVENLDAIWEAHKVRNKIAHDGGDYILTKKKAKDALAQYQAFFEEMGID